MNKAEQYSRDYNRNDFHKSMYTNWHICPFSMDTTFSNGWQIHQSLQMAIGTINHEFHAKLFEWIDERTMWDCITWGDTYKYLSKFVPTDAPPMISKGMYNLVEMETMRWVRFMNESNDPFFWWKPYSTEDSSFVKDCGWYRMVGTIDVILRHFPYEDRFEIWELKAKIDPTRVRRELAFYFRMIDSKIDVVWWGGYGYNDGEMLSEPVNKRSLTAFDTGWLKFLADVKTARNGEELLKKPKYQSAFSGFIPPICTYCNYQTAFETVEGCYDDWKKEY